MYTAFDFDEYWNQFNQSPSPEFFDPVVDILYPDTEEEYPDIEDESSFEQLSLF